MTRLLLAFAAFLALGAVAQAAEFELQEARAQLAPTGQLRAAFVLTNPALVTGEQRGGEVRGPAGDIARAIAERIGVPLQARVYSTRGIFDRSLGAGEWDIEFNTRNTRHATYVDYSANFVMIDQVYLVAPGKTLKEAAEIDRKGVRIATSEGSDAEAILSGTIKEAQILRVAPESDRAISLLKSSAVEVFGDSAEYLAEIAAQVPGTRFLPTRFATVPAAIGVARGRTAALALVNQFLQEAKASGFIARSIEAAHLHGVSVAP